MDIKIKVDGRVLVPRPETEELAGHAADFLKARKAPLLAVEPRPQRDARPPRGDTRRPRGQAGARAVRKGEQHQPRHQPRGEDAARAGQRMYLRVGHAAPAQADTGVPCSAASGLRSRRASSV